MGHLRSFRMSDSCMRPLVLGLDPSLLNLILLYYTIIFLQQNKNMHYPTQKQCSPLSVAAKTYTFVG